MTVHEFKQKESAAMELQDYIIIMGGCHQNGWIFHAQKQKSAVKKYEILILYNVSSENESTINIHAPTEDKRID